MYHVTKYCNVIGQHSTVLASSPGPVQKLGRAWSNLQKFPYVLCQQSSFGVEESCSSIINYYILDT